MKKNLLFRLWIVVMVMSFVGSSTIFAQTLKHSYTFEDGTGNDAVGEAHAELNGEAAVADGDLVLSGGFASISGEAVNVAAYESVTIEALFTQAEGIDGNRSLFSFGTTLDVGWPKGVEYLYYQPTRGTTDSRFAICTGNTDDPWNTESYVGTDIITNTNKHHFVGVVTATEIKMYLDGNLIGSEALTGTNAISGINTDTLYLGDLVFTGDPNWEGSIHEFNIYEGEMDQATISERTNNFIGAQLSDATLAQFTANVGELELTPEYIEADDLYELFVPYGTTSVNLNIVPNVDGVSISIADADGNEYPDGVIAFTGDGVDLEIQVVALDGSTQINYYLSIFLDPETASADLSEIQLGTGKITTEFDPEVYEYTAILPYGTTEVTVTGIPAWAGASVTGGGAVTLVDGAAETTISVTSEDETNTKEYNVTLYVSKVTTGEIYYIQHESSAFVLGESGEEYNLIRIYNPLKDETTQLYQFEESGVEGQYYIKNEENNYLTLVADPVWDMVMSETLTTDLDSSRFELDEFEPGRFRVVSVARGEAVNKYMGTNGNTVEGGVYSDKYIDNELAVWLIKTPSEVVDPYDSYLGELSLSEGSIYPDFDPFVYEYRAVIPAGTTAIDINAVARDVTSSVSGAGNVDVSAGEGAITITVTASDPSYVSTYVINYQVDTELTLKHSYTFADGTANDMVGTAHGTVMGGSITGGVYTADEVGEYIELPASEIAINTYPSITLELYVTDEVNTTNDNTNTMLTYFGDTNEDNNYGVNYLFTSMKCRAAISALNLTSPWGSEQGYSTESNLQDDQLSHHVVSTINNDSISLYVDGYLIGSTILSDDNKIFNLSNDLAYIMKGGYTGDNTFLGSVLEYNVYSGIMDGQTIALRALDYPIDDATTDATLSDLTIDEVTVEGFDPATLTYNITVPQGTVDVPVVDGTTTNPSASKVVTNAAGLPGSATIVVTAADGETEVTYTVNFDFSTDVKKAEVLKTKVYPTVSAGDFWVKTSGETSTVSVFDITGRMIMQEVLESALQSISVPSTGLHIIRVECKGAVEVFKVIKK